MSIFYRRVLGYAVIYTPIKKMPILVDYRAMSQPKCRLEIDYFIVSDDLATSVREATIYSEIEG